MCGEFLTVLHNSDSYRAHPWVTDAPTPRMEHGRGWTKGGRGCFELVLGFEASGHGAAAAGGGTAVRVGPPSPGVILGPPPLPGVAPPPLGVGPAAVGPPSSRVELPPPEVAAAPGYGVATVRGGSCRRRQLEKPGEAKRAQEAQESRGEAQERSGEARRAQERPRRCQEKPMRSEESPGEARRSQEKPRTRPGEAQEERGKPRRGPGCCRSQAWSCRRPGRELLPLAREVQEKLGRGPGEVRRGQEGPGEARTG